MKVLSIERYDMLPLTVVQQEDTNGGHWVAAAFLTSLLNNWSDFVDGVSAGWHRND